MCGTAWVFCINKLHLKLRWQGQGTTRKFSNFRNFYSSLTAVFIAEESVRRSEEVKSAWANQRAQKARLRALRIALRQDSS